MRRNAIAVLAVFYLVFRLLACDNPPPTPIIKPTDAIRLAKQAAAKLQSPPRRADQGFYGGIMNSDQVTYNYPNEVGLWPDTPGTATAQMPPSAQLPPTGNAATPQNIASSLTLTTSVGDGGGNGGVVVTFITGWQAADGSSLSHSWSFQVDSAANTRFLKESGNDLPKAVLAIPLDG